MKVTVRGGKGYAPHNDRTMQQDPKVVNPELTSENWYRDYKHDKWSHTPYQSFKELELEYYREHYEQALEERNKKYLKKGNPGKVKSIEQVYASERKKPHEQVIQIGNHEDTLNKDETLAIIGAYIKQLEKLYGKHMKILDCAIHMDELTPHCHIRYIMEYEGEINQEKSLKALGFEKQCTRKDDKITYSEKARYNNRTISFQKTLQDKLYDLVEKYYQHFHQQDMGLEREPLLPTEEQFHKTNHEYYQGIARNLAEKERSLAKKEQELAQIKTKLDSELDIITKSKEQYKIYKRNKEQDIMHQ